MTTPAPMVSTDEVKRWLDLDPTDDSRDDILQLLIEAASGELFTRLGWDFRAQTWLENYNGRGGSAMAVNQHPIIAVRSLTVAKLVLDQASYDWDETLIYLRNGTFPRGAKLITVSYDAGLPAVPAWAKLACQYTVKAFWQARKTDMNTTGEQFTGIGGASFWPSGPGSVPPQALALIEPFRERVKVSG